MICSSLVSPSTLAAVGVGGFADIVRRDCSSAPVLTSDALPQFDGSKLPRSSVVRCLPIELLSSLEAVLASFALARGAVSLNNRDCRKVTLDLFQHTELFERGREHSFPHSIHMNGARMMICTFFVFFLTEADGIGTQKSWFFILRRCSKSRKTLCVTP